MKAPNPIAFTIFNIDIRWYGILISLGALLGTIIAYKRAPKHGIVPEDILDVILWALPMGIIGARIYYVIFSWQMYKSTPSEIFDIRSGGLAIHGGLIFGISAAYLVCRRKKINFLEMTDLLIPSVALAQSIGRWGNFFNSEAYGTETDLPWAIIVNGRHVHPTFLYESLWCFALFFILIYISKKRKFAGQIFCLYGMLYSLERFFVEGLRTDSLMIGSLRQAQLISLFAFILCLCLYLYFKKRGKNQNDETWNNRTAKRR